MKKLFWDEYDDFRWGRAIVFGILAAFIIVTLFNSYAIIPSGYTGVRSTFGQVNEVVVPNGFTLKIPYVQSIIKVNNKQQESVFEDRIWGESSERTVVYMNNVVVTYRINSEYSAWLYKNVSNYKQNALPSTLVASAMKSAMVSLNSTEVTNRSKIEPIAQQKLQEALDKKYDGERVISIVSVNINNMDFEDDYNTAISNKQLAQLNYEKQKIQNQTNIEAANAQAEQERILAEAEATKTRIAAQANADKRIISAEAEAKSILATAEAQAEANKKLSESLTEDLIDYEKIQTWDGKLPKVTGSTGSLLEIGIE